MFIPQSTVGGSDYKSFLVRLATDGFLDVDVLDDAAIPAAKIDLTDDFTFMGTVDLSGATLVGVDPAGAAATAQTNAEAYADGLAGNYDAAGSAATAQTNAEAYADGLAGNYDAAGAAATAQTNAENYADGLDATAEHTANKGQANGYAELDAGGKVPSSQLPAAVVGAMSYQTGWNANTNSPDVTATAAKGQFWIVETAGATNLSGIIDWQVGDWAVYDGAAWTKIDNTDKVASVNGYVGVVTLDVTDITDAEDVNNKDQADGYAGLNGAGRLTADVRDNSITTDNLQADAVKTAKIENFAVTEAKIDTGAVTADKLGTGSVSTAKLQDNSVDADKLADNAVTTSKLYAEAVTEGKLATGSVTESKVVDGAISTNKIVAYNVTEDRLANDAVIARVIQNGAVEESKLADGAVTGVKTSMDVALTDGSRAFTDSFASAGRRRAIAIKTANYTLVGSDEVVGGNVSGGSLVFTLPPATGSGREYKVSLEALAGVNTLTITADTSGTPDLINGLSTKVLASLYEAYTLVDIAANVWRVF